MAYRGRVVLKAAVWVASLWPLGVLVRGWLADDLTANPIDYVTRTLGLTARLDHFFAWKRMGQDVLKRPFITVGVLALALLIPLAITSTQGMIKRLGGARWRLLHRLVYVAGVLGVLHFLWLAKKGRTTPYYYAIVLGVLLAVRLWDWGRKRLASKALKHEPSPPLGERVAVRAETLASSDEARAE